MLNVLICGTAYDMQIVDGCVIFQDRSGFANWNQRLWFTFENGLWYLATAEDTFRQVPLCHLADMYKLLIEEIGDDHTQFKLKFKKGSSGSV